MITARIGEKERAGARGLTYIIRPLELYGKSGVAVIVGVDSLYDCYCHEVLNEDYGCASRG